MSKHWHDMCLYCTGNNIKDIRECDDKCCVLYQFRKGGLEPEVEREIYRKLMKETGLVE